jgi:hypothetical protein
MVYYLGRDVKVYITTESTESQVNVASNKVTTSDYETAGGLDTGIAAATATVTIGGHTAVGRVITIINTAGTSITYTSAASEDFSSNEFDGDTGSSTVVADSLKAAIEHASGHNGTITVSRSGEVLTLTQAVAGTEGNTTITSTLAATTKTNFTGGTSDPTNAGDGTVFADNLDISPAPTQIPDLTGVDLGIGVVDEDVTYIGSKTVLKAEIKKETTISLTRKKKDNTWDVVYNGGTATNKGWTGSAAETGGYGARWGVIEGTENAWYINNGLMAPKDVKDYGHATNSSFGYRVHIQLNSASASNPEVISIPGCQLTGHSISLNADGTTEETCELISQVDPIIGTALDATNFARMEITDL